jgi:hypothetical protein
MNTAVEQNQYLPILGIYTFDLKQSENDSDTGIERHKNDFQLIEQYVKKIQGLKDYTLERWLEDHLCEI